MVKPISKNGHPTTYNMIMMTTRTFTRLQYGVSHHPSFFCYDKSRFVTEIQLYLLETSNEMYTWTMFRMKHYLYGDQLI